jgi:signal transduction histidine kinase
MTDAERVLAVLIHDVRTPLGVAHGYLRLIRADKLPTAADRDRALAGTQDAIAKVSRLCQDAAAFLDEPPDPAAGRAPASQLSDRVAAALAGRGIAVGERSPLSGSVAVGTSVDRAAEAIATLMAVRAARMPVASTTVEDTGRALRFACGPAGAAAPGGATTHPTMDGAERPFDPWQASLGLGVALAHRFVTALGGRVWLAGDGLALALSLPMETGNE